MSTPSKKKEPVAQDEEKAETVAETPAEVKKEAEKDDFDVKKYIESVMAEYKAKVDADMAEYKASLEADYAKKKAELRPASTANDNVKIVWLCAYDGVMNKVPGITLSCHKYGETFTLSRQQFDAIVGEYHHWFDKGMLAVHHDNIDVAAEKGLKTEDEYALSAKKLERLGSMSPADIRKLWEECGANVDRDVANAQRLSIVSFYKRKFLEGKEPGYRDSDRVLELNKLTKQGLKREAVEISGASLKIEMTDLWDSK